MDALSHARRGIAVLLLGTGCLSSDNPLWGLGSAGGETEGQSSTTGAAQSTTGSSSGATETAGTAGGSPTSTANSTSEGTSDGSTSDTAGNTGWGPPVPVPGVDLVDLTEDDPTLTVDMLEMYMGVDGPASDEAIYVSSRLGPGDPWPAPTAVVELAGAGDRGTPEVAPDGLYLFFHVDEMGDDNIWVSSRPNRMSEWGAPVAVGDLNTTDLDVAATPLWDPSGVLLCSDRGNPGTSTIYIADGDFGALTFSTPVPLGGIPVENDDCTAHLSPDRLTLYFDSNRPGMAGQNIWVATRANPFGDFDPAQAIDEINTDGQDADPWVSLDGNTMYLSQDAGGGARIMMSTREPT